MTFEQAMPAIMTRRMSKEQMNLLKDEDIKAERAFNLMKEDSTLSRINFFNRMASLPSQYMINNVNRAPSLNSRSMMSLFPN